MIASGVQPEIRCEDGGESSLLKARPGLIVAAGSIRVDEVRFAIYGTSRVAIDDQASKVTLHGFEFRAIRVIADDDAAFEAFINAASEAEQTSTVLLFGGALGRPSGPPANEAVDRPAA